MTVTTYLVGAGPGPVDLLTLRAASLLQKATVVIHDALVSADVLALCLAARLIAVGKRAGRASAKQQDINDILLRESLLAEKNGGVVVRLKGGDPLIFARAEEEMAALAKANISFEIVSGITSAQAAFANLKAPLTRRGTQRSVVLTTPQVQQNDLIGTEWARPIIAAGCGAIYMARSATSRIKGTLLALGMPGFTPVTWVSQAGNKPTQGALVIRQTLQTLEAPKLPGNPAVILLIGAESVQDSQQRQIFHRDSLDTTTCSHQTLSNLQASFFPA